MSNEKPIHVAAVHVEKIDDATAITVPQSVREGAPPPLALTPEQDRALYRKIDLRYVGFF